MTVPLFRPNLGDEEIEAAARVLRSGQLTQGAGVRAFEAEFAAYQGAKHAVAVNACTSALYLALKAHGIGECHEVITSAITWPATALAIEWTGATPVFADVDERGLIDVASVRERITPRTAAIIPVHLYGNLAPVHDLRAFGLPLIWDAAHAIESWYGDGPAGRIPAAACFSFYASKNITTGGEGGMLVTDDDEIAGYARRARLFGMDPPAVRTCMQFGVKLNMTEAQAAIGRVQLRRIGERWFARTKIVMQYDAALALATHDGLRPGDGHEAESACHLYPVQVDNRDAVQAALKARGIGTGIHFPPVYAHPYFRGARGHDACPNADRFGARTLSLPLFPEMTPADIDEVVTAFREVTA